MKLTWLALLIVLFDQAIKLLIPMSGLKNSISFSLGSFASIFHATPLLTEQIIYSNLTNSTTLIIAAAVLTAFLFLLRWGGQVLFISTIALVGLQLAAGGLISYAVDQVLRGGIQSTLRLKLFDNFIFNAGIADLALFSGFILLVYVLLSGKTRRECDFPLHPPALESVNFSRLPRGIDNIRIDILLSPEFQKKCTLLIHRLIPLVISNHKEGNPQFKLPAQSFTELQSDFNTLLNLSLRRAKEFGIKQLPDLLFIGTLKFIHAEVSNSVAATINFTKENVKEHHQQGLGRRHDSKYVEWLFRYRDTIITSTNLTMLQGLIGDNYPAFAKAFHSVLGFEKTFTLQAMQTPMVLAETPHDEHLQITHYLLLGQQPDDTNSFVRLDKELSDIFSRYLHLITEKTEVPPRRDVALKSEGLINSNVIDSLAQPSVLMHPDNVSILLDPRWTEEKLEKTNRLKSSQKYRRLKQHQKFQKTLRAYLLNHLQREGHAPWINAAYAIKNLLGKCNTDLSPSALTSVFARSGRQEELSPRLKELFKVTTIPPSLELFLQAGTEIHQQPMKTLENNLFRFVYDFSRYRRDLLLLLTYLRSATQLNLLNNDNDIHTSRANYTLHEFLLPEEITNKRAEISSHIIIKADIRGSTEVTEKLTELSLNPATHFGRNFFTPINEVISSYGAEKVFIEGDAIILILNEYEGATRNSMIASRACGLAARILQIVAKQNRELEVYGLPQLVLGLGIAYCDHAPRYLFDEQHRITISPAINRADRLSACTHSVRKWREKQHLSEDFVEVYQPSDIAEDRSEKAQKDVVFNLNGILVEPAVFDKLRQELTLHPLKNTLPGIPDSELFAFTFPVLSGENQSLVIRKAPIKEFDPRKAVEQCPIIKNRNFYEVVYRRVLLERLRKTARKALSKPSTES